MNIQSALVYVKLGYRIKRACWEPEEFLREHIDSLQRRAISYESRWNQETKKIEKIRFVSDEDTFANGIVSIDDLMATDWEVITTGIRKYFNKYGHLEYEDDTDWDNYVIDDSEDQW
jgi:hypothetical protein